MNLNTSTTSGESLRVGVMLIVVGYNGKQGRSSRRRRGGPKRDCLLVGKWMFLNAGFVKLWRKLAGGGNVLWDNAKASTFSCRPSLFGFHYSTPHQIISAASLSLSPTRHARRNGGAGSKRICAYFPSSAAFRMMLSLPADAAEIICCSIELLILALIF